MVLMFRMCPGEHFTTGALPVLILIISTCSRLGSFSWGIYQLMLLKIYIFPVVIARELFSFLFTSSAALPACRNGFFVATNGSAGEAHTCT